MSNNDLYKSATDKLQKLHDLIYDENGNIRPEFSLTDEELKAFRNHSDESGIDKKKYFENLFGGIIYNKYSYDSEVILRNIYNICYKIYQLCYASFDPYNPNYVYTKSASGWNGNVLFTCDRFFKNVKVSLFNLDGKYEHVINLTDDKKISKIIGSINVVGDKRKINSLDGNVHFKDYDVENYDLREHLPEDIMETLLSYESELSSMLNQLTSEVDNKESGVRR